MFNIKFYEDKNAKSEVYEYMKKLKEGKGKENKQKIKKIDSYIDMLSEYGLSLGEPYIKKLENEIWELRPSKDRILFATLHNNTFIILSMFTKKTQKTPRSEIKKAKRLLNEFRERKDVK